MKCETNPVAISKSYREKNKTNLENCDFILCTGLFDEEKVSYFNRELKVNYIEYF